MHVEKSLNGLKLIITQLEAKLNEINETRQTINRLKSLEEFYAFRLRITQSFFELDQEIRETIQNISDFQLIFKELLSEKNFGEQKFKNLEEKYFNSIKNNEELKKNNRELVFQINVQQEEIIKNENLVSTLTDKIKKMEKLCDKNEDSNSNSKNELLIDKTNNNNSTSDSFNIKNNNLSNVIIGCKQIRFDNLKDNNEKLDSNEKVFLSFYVFKFVLEFFKEPTYAKAKI